MLRPNVDIDSSRIWKKNTIYLTNILGQTLNADRTESVQPQGQLPCLQTRQMDILGPNIFVKWRSRKIIIVTQIIELVYIAMPLFLRLCAVSKFYF